LEREIVIARRGTAARYHADVCGMRWVGYVTALAIIPEQVLKDRDVKR
jgi:hypothetical protein